MGQEALRIPIVEHELPNGLRVILSEDHATPIVAVNLWYHVGSAHEREGRTGFAHLFEHMLFQGSAHVAANEHFELIQRAGGTVNGSTWLDRTNYYETLPSHHLELALWLEADRMGALLPAMTQEKLDTQRDVVKNERRWSVDNQPYGTWWERLPALCFPPGHPFHHSLIGSMDDLSAATLDDIATFFRTYYTPDNAVLSIVGDFESDAALAMVTRHFGEIPRGPGRPSLPSMSVPPTFGGWHRETVEDDVVAARTFLAFRIPPYGTSGWYAASLVSAILGAGQGGRLPRTLVRERAIAASADAYTYNLTKGSDLLVCDVLGRTGVPAATLVEGLVREIERLRRDGVTPAEQGRALALEETGWVAALQSAGQRADKLSRYATYFGNPHLLNEEMSRLAAVTFDELQAAAHDLLGEDNRVMLSYVPRGASESMP